MEDLNSVDIPEQARGAMGRGFGKKLAGELRQQQIREGRGAHRGKRLWWIPALALAASAMAVVFVVKPAWLFGPSPEQMLARAYEADRTWAVRFPGAAYTPQASAARSQAPRNTPLAEGEAAVSRGLDRESESPRWRQLRGRVEFLHHRYDDAIASLQPVAGDGRAAGVLTDLGTTYLARGSAAGNAADDENAVEYLSQALRQNPKDAVALFNRALALEALFLWDQAQQDWTDYLRLDGQGGWAAEARRHLEDISKKKVTGAKN